jgi:hypothetical protein
LVTNNISSGDSTAVQINDGLGISGDLYVSGNILRPSITSPTVSSGVTHSGSSSGTTILQASAAASGTLTLPAATDTLVGRATTDTLTNKTFDTAGTGNVLKINGTQISDKIGTGKAVLDTSPTISSPTLSGTTTANTIVTNDISSSDSTAIQINDGMNISGTLTANTFVTNNISSSESSAIQVDDGMNISGTLTANTFITNNISSSESSAIQVDDAMNVSGAFTANSTVTFNAGYVEKINTLTAGTTITINCALAPVHKVTLTANTGFVITSLPTGGSVTVIIVQDGTGSRTATFGTDTSTTVKFAGGTPTLSTAASSIDIVTIFNDGTNYYGDIGKAYA